MAKNWKVGGGEADDVRRKSVTDHAVTVHVDVPSLVCP